MSDSSDGQIQFPFNRQDFVNLEAKVDGLISRLETVIRLEERQANQGQRIGSLETQLAVVDKTVQTNEKTVDRWITRGITIWAIAVVVFTLLTAIPKFPSINIH